MPRKPQRSTASAKTQAGVRIIGGSLRGRSLGFSGDPATRPMKDRTREALFNLVGTAVRGTHALDLFAGTGALGFEAISRGAERATLIERHFPSAKLLRQTAESLQLAEVVEVAAADAFHWVRVNWPPQETRPWSVFCSPPYNMYVDQKQNLLDLIARLFQESPGGSLIAVESDDRFDPAELPRPQQWDVRRYAPATLAIFKKEANE